MTKTPKYQNQFSKAYLCLLIILQLVIQNEKRKTHL